MLVVALVIGQLTAGLKFQARVATLREERVRALYEMSRDLSGALLAEQIAEIAARFLRVRVRGAAPRCWWPTARTSVQRAVPAPDAAVGHRHRRRAMGVRP